MATGVEELLDMLFEMIDEAKSMPLSSDKCILERDKALDLLECRNAYTDYQRQYESWKNACRKPDTPTHKDEKLSDKLARLQREAAENQNSISRQTKNRGAR